ncbi:MAG: ATP-binding cassette domain-containing protein [Cyclobacteriaceae bacterium]
MNNHHLLFILQESAQRLDQAYDGFALKEIEQIGRQYRIDEVLEFKRDLMEAGTKIDLIYLDNSIEEDGILSFFEEVDVPLILFKQMKDRVMPLMVVRDKKDKIQLLRILDQNVSEMDFHPDEITNLIRDENGKVTFLAVFSYKSLAKNTFEAEEDLGKPMSPIIRLFRLLSEEKKDIFYVYVYAILVGLISLTLPVGIQATVELISGGVIFSSVYLLISFIIIGVLVAGGLQVMQVSMVEYIQRRIFTKTAFEFAFRIPRLRVEALGSHHAPELINRFFDVLTIQKGLPKLFIDLSSGIIQILVGLLLLAFYHPFFILFGLFLVGTLIGIFMLTGPKGLKSSIQESKYKYKVVHWLEELARTINSFKISGNTNLPIRKTDNNVNNYLKNRKMHFNVLISQYLQVVVFKAFITGGLLIIGTLLVVNKEITLGQFVASEVIIILILNSVEKIIMYMDVVYDLLTAVDKISHVTDLPLEKTGGIDIPDSYLKRGFTIDLKNVGYRYQNGNGYTIKDINLHIASGEKICVMGEGGSGKTTLTKIIAGLHTDFEGSVTLNGLSYKDLDLVNLRDKIGKNVSQEDIFDGTILENILVGKPLSHPNDALWAAEQVGIKETLNQLPNGLNTHIISGGKGFSGSFINKLILTRCLAKRPNLLILNDFFNDFNKSDRNKMIKAVIEDGEWTSIIVSNDPAVMAVCDRIVLMKNGQIHTIGSFKEVLKDSLFKELVSTELV